MKILFGISAFPFQHVGGARIYAYHLARVFLHRGHQPMILYPVYHWDQKEGEIHEEEFEGIRLFAFNRRKPIEDPTNIGSYYNQHVLNSFESLLLREKMDMVHFHHTAIALTHAVESAAHKANVASVFTLHMFDPMCPAGNLLYKNNSLCEGPEEGVRCATCDVFSVNANFYTLVRPKWLKESIKYVASPTKLITGFRNRILKKLSQINSKLFYDPNEIIHSYIIRNAYMRYVLSNEVDLLISPSSFLREKFIEWGISPDHIIQLSNGMDTELFKDFKRNPSNLIRFAFMGRFTYDKGIHVLVDAFNRLNAENVRLDIYGEFDKTLDQRYLKDKLEKSVKRDGVNFRGSFDNRKVAEIFKEIDVLVVPSLWYENQPLTVQEAFLSHTPVIASDIGGMAEMVKEGVNGFLFGRGDSIDLANKMKRFVDDRTLSDKLAPTSENVVPMEKHAEELEKIYLDIIEKKRSVRG